MRLKPTIKNINSLLISGELIKKNGMPYSDKSVKHYSGVISMLDIEDFDMTLGEVSVERHKRIKSRLFMDQWCQRLRGKLRAKNVIKNTENNYISVLLWVFSKIDEVYGVKLDTSGPHWSINMDSDNYIPNPEKIADFIKNFKPEKHYQKVAYTYIVAAYYTSARCSDMYAWNRSNISGNKLTYINSKNKKRICITVNKRLESLFHQSYLLPRVSKTTLWRYIKKTFEVAGFDSEISKMVNGKLVVKKEFELISIHRLRASSITGMLSSGMNHLEVKHFSGHSKNSKSFNRYVGFSEDHLEGKINSFINR